jgi:hypothetical protein
MERIVSAKDLEQRPEETAGQWRRRLERLRAADLDVGALSAYKRLVRVAETAARQESAAEELPPKG